MTLKASSAVHSIPLSMSLMTLKIISLSTEPWVTPFITDLHLDIEILTTTLVTISQPVPCPSNSPCIKFIFPPVWGEGCYGDHIRGLAEVQLNYTSSSVYSYRYSTIEDDQVGMILGFTLPFLLFEEFLKNLLFYSFFFFFFKNHIK